MKKVKSALPDYSIFHNMRLSAYYPDIVIEDLKLIIEVDGDVFHNYEKDILRDRILYSLGYKVRRLSAEYCSIISIEDIRKLVSIECDLNLPYYDRIPFDKIYNWKWDINYVGELYEDSEIKKGEQ